MCRGARGAVTLAMAAGLLASCSAPETRNGEGEPRHPASTSSTPSGQAASGSPSPRLHAEQPTGRLPRVPATHDAASLARQLNHAAATQRVRDATTSDLRSAAEFQQLAVRALVTAPEAFLRRVTGLLRPHTARDVGGDVRAGTLLHSMSAPQQQLPRHWRIVAPRPAGELLGYYKRAQRRTGVPWTYLAAIHLVETRMGRVRGTSTAGAQGPMQFLPTTWDLYGAGGDIHDPRDATLAAARLLRHHGAPGDMADALWHYNPSDNYVGAVLEYARTMQRSPAAYGGYWHWRVFYFHERGTYVLPVGYPEKRPVSLPASSRR